MKKITLFVVYLFANLLLNAAVFKTVTISAGDLSSTFTAMEKTSVTDLTVIGKIDARDVKFMRDDLTNLSVLDISSTIIQAYTGSGGTEVLSTAFPANELPRNSFCKNDYSGKITLKSILLPGSLTSIGFAAFQGCAGLTSLKIPATVTSIGDFAFYGCAGLTGVPIPGSVLLLGRNAFSNCTGLTSISIPSSIKSIQAWTFSGCTGLSSVRLPGNLTSIDAYAFYHCSGLSFVEIPDAVQSIGESAFYDCGKLTSVTLPSAVTSIANGTFANCTGLTDIKMSDAVSSIGDWAFLNCPELSNLIISNSVLSIGSGAFYSCTGLNAVTIPSAVTSIGEWSFYGCTQLSSVTIGESIASVGDYAFSDCVGLMSIYAYDFTPVVLTTSVFSSVNKSTCTLYVPVHSKTTYQETSSWDEFFKIVEKEIVSDVNTPQQKNITLFPVPFTDEFRIDGLEGTGLLTLTDMVGKLLIEKQVTDTDDVPVPFLPAGVYIVRIKTSTGTFVRKVLKR